MKPLGYALLAFLGSMMGVSSAKLMFRDYSWFTKKDLLSSILLALAVLLITL